MAYKIDRWIVHADYDTFDEYFVQQMVNALYVAQEAAYRAAKNKSIPLLGRLHTAGGAVKMLDTMLGQGFLSYVTSDETGRTPVEEAKDHMEELWIQLQMKMIKGMAESGQSAPT